MRTLILGGIHSGKSAYAEELIAAATGAESARYLATAVTPATGDPEWTARIDRHRRRRPDTWTTVETGDLAEALRTDATTPSLIDDLGNWVSSYLDSVGGWDDPTVDLSTRTTELCSAISAFEGDLVLVSPEVGLSLVAPTPSGRRFQQELGSVNAAVAAACDRVVLVVAGRPIDLADSDTVVTVTATPSTASSGPAVAAPATAASAAAATPRTPPARDIPQTASPAATDPAATDPVTSVPATVGDHHSAADEFDVIESPSRRVAAQAEARQLQLTKPAGSLGRLEEIANWAASCQGACPPAPFRAPTVVVFAGDHGVAHAGVSAYPPEVTAQMVANISAGGAAINVLAERAGATVRVEDISVDADLDPSLSRFKVRRGSQDLRTTDALTAAEANAAVANGRAIADELVDSGVDLLIAGDLGIGNTTPAAALIGVLTDTEPVVVVGRGTGIDDEGWIRKTAAIRDGMRRGRAVSRSPIALLAAVAGADIAAMAGFLAQAALRRTPVILDGVVVTAAALVAEDLAPGAAQWWLAGHRSDEPAHSIALRQLGLEPVLEFSMRLGEGSGAVTALPIVQAAVATLASMATFADAGVSDADATAPVPV
ncbi:nicotinate-nucleotide--dimethylbenzimidazole phosphoribosyltransferase [Williamsia maris]|uniref:Nicotinate-nucleotide--dimethylbenzimidazole phosphoribosyltransferase n=1 Tax=Williamsia maris TaxID=72806 RepID=A0ABT1HI83_9NOCA|nr:nicotinate-nucleotide--dimethylbenzimidazole phosphoribosyltransferase [Williamsia maris]MCP2177016.1 adenosylcobinamide kinase /nicotinate-nucleotide-dimethylbenzimidazole phosphoribosyltransferase /adenosylcobinamide-phosphate guanylyltransferase [Williamsia maris]